MSVTYGTNISSTPAGNMIYYNVADNTSYPRSGSTIYDLTKSQNTTLYGGANFAIFAQQYCINSAVEGYYTTPGTNAVLIGNNYTYMSWANIKAQAGTWRTLFRTNPNQHPLLVNTDNTIGFYDNTGTGYNTFTGASVSSYIGNWAHYAVVGNGLVVKLYINGVQAGSSVTVSSQTATASGNYHGAWGAGAGSQSFGYISTMKLLPNVALNSNQILAQFNYDKARFGL